MIEVSVVIPSYNAQDALPNTITALKNQSLSESIEIIVVDCSEESHVRQICLDFNVRYHHESERFNPGIGRNIGAKLAKGKLIVFVDADVVLMPNALEEAWNFYSLGNTAFGGALELNEQQSTSIASYLEHYFFNHESQKGRPTCSRSNLSSALMLLDRELFLDQGGFKNIPRMQDTEMTERLLASGVRLSFTPNVVGLQTQDSPMNKVLRKIFINGRNLYFIRYQKQSFVKKCVLFLLLPLLATLKMARVIVRHLRFQTPRQKLITVGISPLLFISGYIWMFGLYRSMLLGGGISTKRD